MAVFPFTWALVFFVFLWDTWSLVLLLLLAFLKFVSILPISTNNALKKKLKFLSMISVVVKLARCIKGFGKSTADVSIEISLSEHCAGTFGLVSMNSIFIPIKALCFRRSSPFINFFFFCPLFLKLITLTLKKLLDSAPCSESHYSFYGISVNVIKNQVL